MKVWIQSTCSPYVWASAPLTQRTFIPQKSISRWCGYFLWVSLNKKIWATDHNCYSAELPLSSKLSFAVQAEAHQVFVVFYRLFSVGPMTWSLLPFPWSQLHWYVGVLSVGRSRLVVLVSWIQADMQKRGYRADTCKMYLYLLVLIFSC